MKYLNSFPQFEAAPTDFSKKPTTYIIYGEVSVWKEQIEELSYIINDIDGDVQVLLGSVSGRAKISVNLISRISWTTQTSIDYPKDNIREWVHSLPFNESYLEYIDRIRSIIGDGYEIYTKEWSSGEDWDFNFLDIREAMEPIDRRSGYGRLIPLEEAIDKLKQLKNLGFVGKIKRWLKK